MPISVIVPTLDEAAFLAGTLASARDGAAELIVVDGGSRDGTLDLARGLGARVMTAPRGRARQMNAGARAARGDILLFLHADTRLPPGYGEELQRVLAAPGVVAGAFRLAIAERSRTLRIIAGGANWRSRLLQQPYGDQALFVTARRFRALGGFPDLPIMEDYELIRRLRRTGRVRIASAPVLTSSRRWRERGSLKTTVLNQLAVAAYLLGVAPERIARMTGRAGHGEA